MTMRIGDVVFDHVDYDEGADVLYLHVGDPRAPPSSSTSRPRVTRFGLTRAVIWWASRSLEPVVPSMPGSIYP